jgi:hypothetical protein
MKNSDNSNGSKPAAFGNTLLPAVFYGVFKIQRKGVSGHPTPQLYTSAFASIVNNECEIVTAHDIAFKSEEEAKELLSKLPKPAMYLILPVYMAV